MVIDFRVRPPFGKFRTLGIFNGLVPNPDPKLEAYPGGYGRERMASAMEDGGMEKFMLEMDQAGVHVGVIMGRVVNNAKFGGDSDNDDIFELCKRYPTRFVGFAGIDPVNSKSALDEVRKAADRGFKGIAVDPGWYQPEMYADDPKLMLVYEEAAKLGLITSITTSVYLGSDVSFSDPAPVHRVARAFPEMPVVIPHACWPYIAQALGMALISPNVYLIPDVYMYVPGFPFVEDIVKASTSFLKHKLLFASSYPVRGLPQCVRDWKALPFENDALLASLFYNAQRLLKL